jgi:phospholipid/cholesterol/gamma-HCH transport system substrate-binding protein
MKISNETKVGALTALALTLLILGYNYMKGERLINDTQVFHAVYPEVDGLFSSNPVNINGHKVGQVSNVQMNYSNLQVVVTVKIPKEIKVPVNSTMLITNNDLVGSKAVEFVLGDSSELATSGDTLEGLTDEGFVQGVSKILTPLTRQVGDILGKVDTAVTDVSLQKTLADLSLTLKAFQQTANHLNQVLDGKDQQLDKIFTDLSVVTGKLRNASPKVDSILGELQTTSSQLAQADFKGTVERLDQTAAGLKELIEGINSGEGSLGQLATNKELYNNLNQASKNLDALLLDIKKYPDRYTGITARQRRKANEKRKEEK